MGSQAILASTLAAFLLSTSAAARAQSARVSPHAQLPPVPVLKLSWPVAPLSFTVTGQSLSLFGLPSLALYETSALWLQQGPFKLLTFGSSTLAAELDCRLTCQPVLQHSFGVEARYSLPISGPQLTDPHAFVRYSGYQTSLSPRGGGLLHVGMAGAFAF